MSDDPPVLETERLRLEPLRVAHAREMAGALADPALYAFIGGEPPTVAGLRRRYRTQVAGWSDDGRERWLNWVVRPRAGGAAIGFVQATVVAAGDDRARDRLEADLAWVIGVRWQGHGAASEAARAMLDWLVRPAPAGGAVAIVTAHIDPGHAASGSVARRLGLVPTDLIEDGEVVWRLEVRGPGRTRGGDQPGSPREAQ